MQLEGGIYQLAIDPGTHLGYAFTTPATKVPTAFCSGTLDLSPGRYQGGGMRFLRLQKWLDELEPRVLYFEEVRAHKGTAAAHVYGGLVATITAWCEVRSIPYLGVPVGTIKKVATGKGNAPKEAMLAAARERWGELVKTHDQADALWLLETAIQGKA